MHAPIEYETRHPALLPANSVFIELVIGFFHKQAGHGGLLHTFCLLKQHYCLQGGSSAIRRVFFHTGVDCFGPLFVKQGRSRGKRYGCIFSCMTTRAVHLEVLHSLSCDSFISALRRFIARRGSIGHLHSDNGTNFVGGNRVINEAIQQWNQRHVSSFLLQKEIEWHFNAPLASHFGGSWEQLIRSVRKVLGLISAETTFSEEGLATLCVEVEGIVNSRPLSPLSFVDGLDKPLTPRDVLMICADSGLPPVDSSSTDAYFVNRWRHVQHFADVFWKRWSKEYLPTLNYHQKWLKPCRNICVNDIVILVDQATPCSQLPLGRVIKSFPDKENSVRSVQVKTSKGTSTKPISKLCVVVSSDSELANLICFRSLSCSVYCPYSRSFKCIILSLCITILIR